MASDIDEIALRPGWMAAALLALALGAGFVVLLASGF